MTANKLPSYWRSNDEWYDYDENNKVYLTDKAPEEARKSFEEYQKIVEWRKKHGI